MARDDALHVRKTDPGTLEFLGTMQPLKHSEQPVCVCHVEADAVVFDVDDSVSAGAVHAADLYGRIVPGSGVLECVRQQVVEDELQHGGVAGDRGQLGNRPRH